MTIKKKKVRYKRIISAVLVVFVLVVLIKMGVKKIIPQDLETFYIAATTNEVTIYDQNYKEVGKIKRGQEVKAYAQDIVNDQNKKVYKKIIAADNKYLIDPSNLVASKDKSVLEKRLYVKTNATIYEKVNESDIVGSLKKGAELEIISFNKLDKDGNVDMYKVKLNDLEGYVHAKYLVATQEEADQVYDKDGSYNKHVKRGPEALSLDFFPRDKPKFPNNVMPEETRTLYLNSIALRNVDKYIELAKKSNINAFVVDIKEEQSPGYKSPVMEQLSPKSYKYAHNSMDNYRSYIKKLKDNGFYVIGRITAFKDSYYVADHPEYAITSISDGTAYKHNSSYWPSAFVREVWEYNVKLAIEAVKEMGFNEIQFDYVRFPDGIVSLQENGIIDMKNKYNEYRSQAIQAFLIYATDEIHKVEAYVSADVFGESAHDYVTSYGQYWGAISNVVDVISPMPYPDHFNSHQYNMEEVVWTVPYKLLLTWGRDYVQKRQAEIPSPAPVRSWIQAYDTTKNPPVIYDVNKIEEQIKALHDIGFTGGYMTWHASSNYNKYSSIAEAFKKEYD